MIDSIPRTPESKLEEELPDPGAEDEVWDLIEHIEAQDATKIRIDIVQLGPETD